MADDFNPDVGLDDDDFNPDVGLDEEVVTETEEVVEQPVEIPQYLDPASQGQEQTYTPPQAPEVPLPSTPSRQEDTAIIRSAAPTKTESAGAGLGQGLTFGLTDEIIGAYDALKNTVFGDKPLNEFVNEYTRNRDYYRKLLGELQTENPGSYLGGQVTGGIASAVPGAVAGGTKLATQVGIGALEGAGAGFGGAEGDLGEQATQTALGGTIGALAPAGTFAAGGIIKQGIIHSKKALVGSGKVIGKFFHGLDEETKSILRENKELVNDSQKFSQLKDKTSGLDIEVEKASQKIDDIKTSQQQVRDTIKNTDDKFEKIDKGTDFIEDGVKEGLTFVRALGKVAKGQEETVRKTLAGTTPIDSREVYDIVSEFKKLTQVSGTVEKAGKEIEKKTTKFGFDKKIVGEIDKLNTDITLRASKGGGITQEEVSNYIKGIDDLIDYGSDQFGRQGTDLLSQMRGELSELLKSKNSLYATEVEKLSNNLKVLNEAKKTLNIKGGFKKGFEATNETRSAVKGLFSETAAGKRGVLEGIEGGDEVVKVARAREDYLRSLLERKKSLDQNLVSLRNQAEQAKGGKLDLLKKIKEYKKTIRDVDSAIKKTEVNLNRAGGFGLGGGIGYAVGSTGLGGVLGGVAAGRAVGPAVAGKYFTSALPEVASKVGGLIDETAGAFGKLGEKVGGYTPGTTGAVEKKAIDKYKKGQK